MEQLKQYLTNIRDFFNRFSKKEKRNFLILGGIILLILVGLVAVSQRQLIKKRAAGSGQIDIRFVPGPGSNLTVSTPTLSKIRLYNTSSFLSLTLSGAQATFTVTNLNINAASVRCLDPFRGIGYKNINGSTVTIMCAVPPDPLTQVPPTVAAGSSVDFAEVEFTPVTTGNASVTFNTTRVTGIGQAGSGSSPDFSTAGQNATYTVEPAATGTPIPGASNTPIPTPIGQPPECDQGISIENVNFTNNKFEVLKGTTVKLMAYGVHDRDLGGNITNVSFRFKPKNNPACPTANDGSLIGPGTHTADINGTDVWTIMWDTTNVISDEYDVWASPTDNDTNSCSGNPAANAGNNYCGTSTGCQNCKTVANVSVWVSGTPVPVSGTPVPTQTPIPTPSGNEGFDFLVLAPDISSSLNTITAQNVKVEVYDGSTLVASPVTPLTRVGNYFKGSARFTIPQSKAYTVMVKAVNTIRRSFASVTLSQGAVLDCATGQPRSGSCGELGTETDNKTLLGGDTNGFNTLSGSYNKIDILDYQSYISEQRGVTQTKLSDFNGDSVINTIDLGIFARNYGAVGE